MPKRATVPLFGIAFDPPAFIPVVLQTPRDRQYPEGSKVKPTTAARRTARTTGFRKVHPPDGK